MFVDFVPICLPLFSEACAGHCSSFSTIRMHGMVHLNLVAIDLFQRIPDLYSNKCRRNGQTSDGEVA